MRNLTTTTATLMMVSTLAAVSIAGCASEEVADPEPQVEAAVQADVPPEVAAELANLSESDRQLAAKQRICPVADGLLGSMGTPEKLVVEGREVFICCEGCEEELRSDPEKYFAKIDNQ